MWCKKSGVCLAAAGLLVAICALAPAEDQTVTPREGTVGTEADGQVDAPKGADTSAAESITPVEGQPKVKILTRLFKLPSGWSFKKFLKKVLGQKSLWVDVIPGEVDGYPLEVPVANESAIQVNRVFDENVTNAGGFPLQLEGNLRPPKRPGKQTDQYWAVKVAPMVAIQEIQGHPNNDLALNNEFIKQEGTVGVLKGFKVKYIGTVKSPGSGDTYTWQYRGHEGQSEPADWTDFGTGLTYIHDENTVGDYDVRLKLSRGGQDYYSDTRRVMVAEVRVDVFTLTNSSNYVADQSNRHWVHGPGTPFRMDGNLAWDADPHPENIEQGFIQGVSGTIDWVFPGNVTHHVHYKTNLAVEYISDWHKTFIGFALCNDAPERQYLYGTTSPSAIGAGAHATDPPGCFIGAKATLYPENATGKLTVEYPISRNIMQCDFTVWLVAQINNADPTKPHFVPFRQQGWELKMDTTTQNGPWQCTTKGSPADPSSAPTNGMTGPSSGSMKLKVPDPGPKDTFMSPPN